MAYPFLNLDSAYAIIAREYHLLAVQSQEVNKAATQKRIDDLEAKYLNQFGFTFKQRIAQMSQELARTVPPQQ